jgi:hypothetical protein
MVSMFRYRKLYVDLVTERGEVCVGYATWLKLAGYGMQSAGFERYTPQGERRVERAVGAARFERRDGSVRLALDTARGPFAIELIGARGTSSEPQSLTPHLSWQVLARGAEARLTLARGEVLIGSGYADYVEMTRPPRALGLLQVEWGRGHAGADGFVFTRATFRDGKVFASALEVEKPCAEWRLSARRETGIDLQLPGGAVTLQNTRVLHEGSALDRARFPGACERLLARFLSGKVQETRWLARAEFASGSSAWALHERVLLG